MKKKAVSLLIALTLLMTMNIDVFAAVKDAQPDEYMDTLQLTTENEFEEKLESNLNETIEDVDNEAEIVEAEPISPSTASSLIASGSAGLNLIWEVTKSDEGNILTIKGTGNMWYTGAEVRPWVKYGITKAIIEEGVIDIADCAFRDCKNLIEVSIPNSVTYIGDLAFATCESLTEVTLSKNVTNIGTGAFYECKSLEEITIPNGVTYIDEITFSYCESLKEVIIPSSVKSIEQGAFFYCKSLEELIIPDSVTKIGDLAFGMCESLTEVTLSNNVTNIGIYAFALCTSLVDITLSESITQISDYLLAGCESLVEITIPSRVTEIGEYAFVETGIKELTIPDSVNYISDCLIVDEDVVIIGSKDSYAKDYAEKHNLTFISDKQECIEHSYTDWYTVKKATCTEEGKEARKCSCGNKETRVMDKLGHDYEALVTEPTCMKKGSAIYICKNNSKHTYTEELDYVDHIMTFHTAVEPRCERDGNISYYTCNMCGKYFADKDGKTQITADKVVVAGGHIWKNEYTIDKAATCVAAGVKSIHCSVCDAIQENSEKTIEALGHTYNDAVTIATITADGKITTTCSVCDDVYITPVYRPVTINLSKTSFGYNGKNQMPDVTIRDSNGGIISGSDYTVTYPVLCKNLGTYTVKVTFQNNYSGQMSKSYKIVKGTQVISASNKTFTTKGSAASLGAKRTAGNGTLSYKSSNTKVATITSKGKITPKAVGTATITIAAKATSTYNAATKKITVTVNPKGNKLSSIASNKNGQITVGWKKASGINGYQLRYSTSSKMTNAKTISAGTYKATSKTITGLSKGKKYYVQLRTYKKLGSKTYYSSWSSAKGVTTMNASLSATKVSIKKGTSKTLTVKNRGSKKVKWTTSNKKIATVSSSGKITAKAIGSCTITATVGSQKLYCKVSVNNLYTDSKPHIKGSISGKQGGSVPRLTLTNQGNSTLEVVYLCYIYPYGGSYKIRGYFSRDTYEMKTISIAPGETESFIVYAEYPVYLTDDATVGALVRYKGKTYGFSMPKSGTAIVAPAN